ALTVLPDGDEPSPLQHPEVLRDRGLTDQERLGELRDRRFAFGEPREDRASRRVCEGQERCAQAVGCIHRHRQSITLSFNNRMVMRSAGAVNRLACRGDYGSRATDGRETMSATIDRIRNGDTREAAPARNTIRLRSSDDIAREAVRRLPRFLSEYLVGGSFSEHTLRRNVEDLAGIEVRQRVLANVADVDTTKALFGRRWSLPVGLGPIGISGMFARRGEVQAAQAAESANVPFCLSTVSICSLEEVRS